MLDFKSYAKQFTNKDVLDVLAQSVGGDTDKVGKATALGLPAIMEALNRNTNTEEGAQALTNALEQHKGADTGNIKELLKNADLKDGEKIIKHVFGEKSDSVVKSISKKSGLGKDQIVKLLIQFAPAILKFLGSKKEEEELDSNGVAGLTSVLSGLFGKSESNSSSKPGGLLSMASSLLDDDDDDDDNDGQDLLGLFGKLFR